VSDPRLIEMMRHPDGCRDITATTTDRLRGDRTSLGKSDWSGKNAFSLLVPGVPG
jgi:hypothetical protein